MLSATSAMGFAEEFYRLRIHIFGSVIRCSTQQLWVGLLIYLSLHLCSFNGCF